MPECDVRTFSKHIQSSNTKVKNFKNLKDALSFNPDAAVIANPSSKHISVAKPLLMKGVHLLIEKPISSDSAKVMDLLRLANEKKCLILVGYNLRFNESLIKFKEIIFSEVIGDIYSIHSTVGQNLETWRPSTDYRKSVSAKRNLGGGVLLELSHEIDYLKWIFGEIDCVAAMVGKNSNLSINVEDFANILIKFKKNKENKNHIVASLSMDFYRHDSKRVCEVIGEKGTLVWDGISNKVKFYNCYEKKWKTLFSKKLDRNSSYIRQWKYFVECINFNRVNELKKNALDSFNTLKVTEAAKKSSQSKMFAKLKSM